MVLICREEYDGFLEEYLKTNPKPLSEDPTLKVEAKVDKIVNNKKFPQIWKHNRITAPICPRLFGYVKTHKDPIAMKHS